MNLTVNLAWRELKGLNRNGWNIKKELLENYFKKIKATHKTLQIPIILKGRTYNPIEGVPAHDIIGFVNDVDLDSRQANISIYKNEFSDIFKDRLLGFGLIAEKDENGQVITCTFIPCAYPIEEINSIWR